jgi:hypothetical protein
VKHQEDYYLILTLTPHTNQTLENGASLFLILHYCHYNCKNINLFLSQLFLDALPEMLTRIGPSLAGLHRIAAFRTLQ